MACQVCLSQNGLVWPRSTLVQYKWREKAQDICGWCPNYHFSNFSDLVRRSKASRYVRETIPFGARLFDRKSLYRAGQIQNEPGRLQNGIYF